MVLAEEFNNPDLVGKPNTFRATLLLLVRIFFSPLEKENETVYRAAASFYQIKTS